MSDYTQQLTKARHSQKLVWILTALIFFVILWANFASLDEVVSGEGTLIPSSAVQKIQSLDGGVLLQLHVQQGEIVSDGQLLVSLDETRRQHLGPGIPGSGLTRGSVGALDVCRFLIFQQARP